MKEAEVAKRGFLDMQVCVPGSWDDIQVIRFAEEKNPCGTTNGWFIRKEDPERTKCHDKKGFVHIVLNA